jgi:S1-C subfamily serine protease
VPAIAKQVTVRILTNSRMGSGVIIQRQGQTYTVVTNAHVVADTQDNRYTLLTADGQTHTGQWLRSTKFPNLDLAVMQFTSNRAYQVAAIADSKALAVGDPVYAAGFPNWHWINSNEIEETRKWGTRAFRLTTGKVEMLLDKSLQEGYQLGYTNEIEEGMSGGPVLDKYGRLIGINGRLKYPPQGIIAFIFADGITPSEELFQQMEALSWAIPSATFQQALK